MIDVPLSAADHKAFMRALKAPYRSRTRVQILDRDEEVTHDLTDRVVSGSVNVDRTQPVDRSLDIQLADLDRAFGFAPDSPDEFSLFADNFIRVRRGVYVAEISRWVDVPMFTGPITRLERHGSMVDVTAVGKESLALAPMVAWKPLHIPKGRRVVAAIREVLAAQGERHFDLPDANVKLRKPVSMGRTSEPWKVASKLALSIDRQLFYDGRGKVRLRTLPPHPVFTFRTGEGGTIAERPTIAFDMDRVRNTVQVLGPKPEGQQKRIRYVAFPPKGHPLSPWRLARNGHPRYIVEFVEAEHIHRVQQARRQAERKLDDLLRAEVDITFDAVPILPLEPGDLVAVNIDGEVIRVRAETFSMPVIRGTMSVGSNRRVGTGKGRK